MSLPRVKLPPLISIGHKNTPEKRKGKKTRKIIVSGRYCNDAVVKASQRVVTIFFLLLFAWEKKSSQTFFKTPFIHLKYLNTLTSLIKKKALLAFYEIFSPYSQFFTPYKSKNLPCILLYYGQFVY